MKSGFSITLALAAVSAATSAAASVNGGGSYAKVNVDQPKLVVAGPDPKEHQVVRWRCVDLCAEVARRFSVTVPERTIGKWLRKLKLTRLQPRPYHPKKDAAAQEAFKKNFSSILKEALLTTTAVIT